MRHVHCLTGTAGYRIARISGSGSGFSCGAGLSAYSTGCTIGFQLSRLCKTVPIWTSTWTFKNCAGWWLTWPWSILRNMTIGFLLIWLCKAVLTRSYELIASGWWFFCNRGTSRVFFHDSATCFSDRFCTWGGLGCFIFVPAKAIRLSASDVMTSLFSSELDSDATSLFSS